MEFIDDIILNEEFKWYIDSPGDALTPYLIEHWRKWLSAFGLESAEIGGLTLDKYLLALSYSDTPEKIENYCATITSEEAQKLIYNIFYDAIKITNNYSNPTNKYDHPEIFHPAMFSDMVKECYRIYAFGGGRSRFAKKYLVL